MVNSRADEYATAGTLLPESFSIEVDMPLAAFKLAFAWKLFQDENLPWVNEEACFSAIFTWLLIDRRCMNQLLGLDRDIILITVAMLTGHCVMGKHAENMHLPSNDFYSGYRSTGGEDCLLCLLLNAGTDCLVDRFLSA